MKKRIAIVLGLCTLLSLVVAGCSSNEVSKVEGLENQGIKEIYSKTLKENEEGIKACSFIIEDFDDKDNAFCKPVAFLDLNGNGVSELLYFTAGDDYNIELNIRTFQENKLVKVDFSAKGLDEGFFYWNSWCIFAEKNGDLFCVPRYNGDYHVYSHYGLGKTAYKQPKIVETFIDVEDEETDEYDALLKKWNGDRKKLIFYNNNAFGYEKENGGTFELDSLLKPFKKSDALQMSYDEAMEILSQ